MTAITDLLPVGAFRTDDHFYYFNGKGPYPSVTTILDVMSKPALIQWKAMEAARAMYRFASDPLEDGFQQLNEDDSIKWALKEADKARDDAARIGSSLHLLADMVPRGSESHGEGFQVSDEVKPYLEAFRGFLDRYSASSIVSSEKMVLNWEGYAGTYDMLMRIEEELWLLDIKTSKGFYPEYGLQLAGYRHADVIILPDNPVPYPMPLVDRVGVLHLRPDQYPDTGWRLIEYPVDETDYYTFLSLLKVYEWRKRGRFTKTNLVGRSHKAPRQTQNTSA